jgi:uroporphyrinogen decarboxylase
MSDLIQFLRTRSPRAVMPILTFPGAALVQVTVRQMVTSADAQVRAVSALHARYRLPVVLSAMDLSVEAEAFGCEVHFSEDEIPTVLGRRVTTADEARALSLPEVGAVRTRVYLETVARLRGFSGGPKVLGGMIGPFSLAARIFGVSEMLGLTVEDPALAHVLIEKAATFLAAYARAFKDAGAAGVIMAEPTAGLLSPRALGEFSSAYVKRVVTAVDGPAFALLLHNCAAKLIHLPHVLAAQARGFHFGSPMDLAAALRQVPAGTLVCGNLDPSRVFVQSQPDEVRLATRSLLAAVTGQGPGNHILSSGCDIPPKTPLANLDAFFEAATATSC